MAQKTLYEPILQMHMLHVVKVSKIQNEFELYDTEPGSLDIEFFGACLFFLVSFSDM